MKRLTEIGRETYTDKAYHHQFTEIYDDIFREYISPRILEIGVADCSSIRMYEKYFKNPYIVGMDISGMGPQCNGSTIKFVQGDQSNIEDLKRCVEGESPFDIILDDGGHTMKQQQVSFGFLIDYVKAGGYYILEDLHTSLPPLSSNYIEEDCEITSLDMVNKIKNGEYPFSNYIELEQQKRILSKIENAQIWVLEGVMKPISEITNPIQYYSSVTSIIKIKD